MTDINIRILLEAGHAELQRLHKLKEQAVLGHPRIGSIGCVSGLEVYGVCHRVAHARQLGIDKPVTLSQDILFKAGEANEYTWMRILDASGYTGKFLQHDEVAVKEPIPGVPLEVLGHPDIVLADENGVPVKGLELKGIFGDSMAVGAMLEATPKNENLIQTAGYSHFMKIKYDLCYTLPAWVKLQVWDKKKYQQNHVLPQYHIFNTEWRDGTFWYKSEFVDEWTATNITVEGIFDYYRLLQEMKVTKDLGPRPTSTYVSGKPDKWGPSGQCGLCEYKDACTQYDVDKDYDIWLATLKGVG